LRLLLKKALKKKRWLRVSITLKMEIRTTLQLFRTPQQLKKALNPALTRPMKAPLRQLNPRTYPVLMFQLSQSSKTPLMSLE
jgi:hypothetical protein